MNLRARLQTEFHRELVTPDWLDSLGRTLTERFGEGYEAMLVALDTEPESVLKYQFVGILKTALRGYRLRVQFEYIPESQGFKIREMDNRFRIRGESLEDLLRHRLIEDGEFSVKPTGDQVNFDYRNPKVVCLEQGILPLEKVDGALRVGFVELKSLNGLRRWLNYTGPILPVLLGQDEFRRLHEQAYGPPLSVEEVSIHVLSHPTGEPLPALEHPPGDGFRLHWQRHPTKASYRVAVTPNIFALIVVDAGGRLHETAFSGDWNTLIQRSRAAFEAPVPFEHDQHSHRETWTLELNEGESLRTRKLHQPVWSPFLEFCLETMQIAGVELGWTRESRIE